MFEVLQKISRLCTGQYYESYDCMIVWIHWYVDAVSCYEVVSVFFYR